MSTGISSSQSSQSFGAFGALVAQNCSNSPRAGRSDLLRIAQSAPRAAQSRPERSLRAVRGTAQGRPERAQSWSELLRVAQSAPRAAQSRSESFGACSEPLRAALNRPERSLRAARKTDRGARCHMHFAYQMLSFTSHGSLFSVHVYARVRASIYIILYIHLHRESEGETTQQTIRCGFDDYAQLLT